MLRNARRWDGWRLIATIEEQEHSAPARAAKTRELDDSRKFGVSRPATEGAGNSRLVVDSR